MEFLLIASFLFIPIYLWIKKDSDKYNFEVEKNTLLKVQNMIDSHAVTLGKKYNQTVYKDDYGNFIDDEWVREIRYFVENVVIQDASIARFLNGNGDRNLYQNRYLKIAEMIYNTAISQAEKNTTHIERNFNDVQTMQGSEFEILCADLLKANLWSVTISGGGNDQGIDIYGEIYGLTAVFQCKRYDSPVGNSAVQEVISGRIFANSDLAVVITNSSFTKSARKLANSANVILLHYSEIEKFSLSLLSESQIAN